MAELTVASRRVGDVLVSEDLVELLGAEHIDAAVNQLRLNGGNCWACEGGIHHPDDVSLVVRVTAVGGKTGFIHMRCGPPQILDERRNRRAAIAMSKYLLERGTDAQAFAGVRSYPAPHSMLFVSLEAPVSATAENGERTSPWLDLLLGDGLQLLPPDVFDAQPQIVDGWTLRIAGSNVTCQTPRGALSEGLLEMPKPWLAALAAERSCVVVATGIAVDGDRLGPDLEPALNSLAANGLVV
ncbi:MAG TPA: hypothetical protein VFB34_06150, partial [Chloroflexota bacterium]|nr:hypothetical protein [Chloroflexota bacterium]